MANNKVLKNLKKGNSTSIRIVKVSYDDLVSNESNYYDTALGLDDLVESIKENGLMSIITAIDNEDGSYTIIGGHRRYLALGKLIGMGFKEYEENLPIQLLNLSDNDWIKEELTVMEHNQSSRDNFSSKVIMVLIERLNFIYEQLEQRGEKPTGLKRDWIAKKLHLSSRTVQDYLSISTDEELTAKLLLGERASTILKHKKMSSKNDSIKVISTLNKHIDFFANVDLYEVFEKCEDDEKETIIKKMFELNNILSGLISIKY